MDTPSEGKVLEAEYYFKTFVPGLAEVEAGYRPPYPVTVYNLTGDDTSGVAGLLMPDGTFLAAPRPRAFQWFWEHEETDRYEKVLNRFSNPSNESVFRVVGDSWRVGRVVWDGSVVGSISQLLDGDETDKDRTLVNRRTWDANLTGDWMTTGELWRALERGTGQTGRQLGRRHDSGSDLDAGAWAA